VFRTSSTTAIHLNQDVPTEVKLDAFSSSSSKSNVGFDFLVLRITQGNAQLEIFAHSVNEFLPLFKVLAPHFIGFEPATLQETPSFADLATRLERE